MFLKPYRVKSSVQLKSSEKKKFRQGVERCYPNTAITEVITNKANVTLNRLVPHQEGVLGMIQVHSIEKMPMFLTMDRDSVPIPTVHTLWQLPHMLPRVTMPGELLQKLLGGADLMLPGIIPDSLPDTWYAGEVVSVCTTKNGAALAVGIWAVDKSQAIASNMKGKGIHIYQIYQDELWKNGSRDKIPNLPPPGAPGSAPDTTPVAEEQQLTEELGELSLQSGSQQGEEAAVEEADGEPEEPEGPNMDDMIREACYRAIKTSLGKDELPILISTFYAKHVKPCGTIPIEIKKSSYKKVGTLIKLLQSDGILTTKEQKKGVVTIDTVQWSHPSLRGLAKLEKPEEDEEEEEEEEVAVVSAFVCNAAMLPLFSKYGHRKGEILSKQQVRHYVTEYIKTNQLSSTERKGQINLDPLLSTLIKTRELTSNWNQVMQKISSGCGQCYIISLPEQAPIVVKGELPPISFKVEKRSGNKKMTIISKFNVFGIDAKELSHKLQLAMSSSASVVLGAKDLYEVQVQGDARKTATKILIEEYHIPKNFIMKI